MERNLRLYPIFNILFNGYYWGAVFFLYLNERVSLEEVLWLQACYYLMVVILEVPSGYFSDYVGRKTTLLIASFSFVLANSIFYFGTQFSELFLAECFMAIGFSFYSGTNHSFHYDSLKSLGLEHEFGLREQNANGYAMVFRAFSSIVGGIVAMYAFKNPYGLAAITSMLCFLVALAFEEPVDDKYRLLDPPWVGFRGNLKVCIQLLKDPKLKWLFSFMVVFTVVVHIPFEFFQPYIALLKLDFGLNGDDTPLVTGTIRALGTFMAAYVAFKSIKLSERLGLMNLLSLTVLAEGLIALGMGLLLHPMVIPLILLRTVPEGIMHAPFTAAVNPLVQKTQRATFFSLNSLAGRIAYSVALYLLSLLSLNKMSPDWKTLALMLKVSAGFGVISFIGLWLKKRNVEV